MTRSILVGLVLAFVAGCSSSSPAVTIDRGGDAGEAGTDCQVCAECSSKATELVGGTWIKVHGLCECSGDPTDVAAAGCH